MAEAKSVPKEFEAQVFTGAPAPQPVYPIQPSTSYQNQTLQGATGYSPQMPMGYVQQPMVITQPAPGSNIQVATQSSLVIVGQAQPGNVMGPQQGQPMTCIKQPVSMGFGPPMLYPGVPKPMVIQQMAPPTMPVAPPPYPGPPQDDVKYSLAAPPENLYGKK